MPCCRVTKWRLQAGGQTSWLRLDGPWTGREPRNDLGSGRRRYYRPGCTVDRQRGSAGSDSRLGREDPGRRDQPIRTDVIETSACGFGRPWIKRDHRRPGSWRPCCESLQLHQDDELCCRPKRGEATRVLLVSGDDARAKQIIMRLIEELGCAPIELGGLVDGGRKQQAGGPLATGRDLLVAGDPVTHQR
jgi:hypothetical protein